jgi:CubicO group peptidase (beta-lactamase class C family)
MRRFLFLLVAALLLHPTALAQADPGKLDAYFAKARVDWEVPGMAVAIVKDDKVVFAKGYGVRELGKPSPVDEHTVFAIASNTKAFTAAALAILADEKKIAWDDRVQKYLPYFQLYDPYVSADTRIADLLSHRSGLGTFSGDLIWYGTPYSREEVVRRARFLPQAFPFRAGYGYSNIMYLAAGEVIEKASGKTWEEFIKERFLAPLGMRDTVLSVKELSNKTNVATPHGESPYGESEGKLTTFPWYNWDSMVPAGGIISSASDMAQWLRLQLNRGTFGGKQIYSDQQSRLMWTPHNSFTVSKASTERNPNTNFNGYGLGWGLNDYKGNLVATHTGGYDGMYSRVVVVPQLKLGLVILTNSMTDINSPLMYRTLDAFIGGADRDWSAESLARTNTAKQRKLEQKAKEDKQRITNTRPSLPLAAYAGTYGGPMYGDVQVTVEGERLAVKFLPNPDLTGDLTHWHFDTFEVRWRKRFAFFGKGKVQFLLDEQGKVTEMKVNVPNDDFWFTELEFKKK